jgi:uncharacterized protein (TIGR00255 family)
MTGFGAAHAVVRGIDYNVEIRSVNHRFFKAFCRLPEVWAGAETDIEQLLRKKVQRGSVSLRLRMKVPEDQAAYRVNNAALMSYIDQIKLIEVDAGPTMHVDLGVIMQLPGVCEPPDTDELCEATRDGLMKLVDSALDGLVEMREREGEALVEELLGLCGQITRAVGEVQAKAPLVVKAYQERLTARVAELLDGGRASLDADALAREVAVFAERCDTAEEISRLNGHVEQFSAAVAHGGPAGRKLEFIAQEMLREANTIASKANDMDIANHVVAMKTAIDRIKEQVANVE